jgi:hypothetical protein
MTAAALALPAADVPPPQDMIASLAQLAPPLDLDRFGASFGLGPGRSGGPLCFRFCFKEVPFTARIAQQQDGAALSLTGDLGTLPFTAESPRRRRRLRLVLAAARRAPGMAWEITGDHHISVSGETMLALPLTPVAVIAAATGLLLRSRPYLELIVGVAGEA